MDKKLLKINELEPGKLYDMVNNPFPNHLLYYVDEDGFYYQKDLIEKTQGKSMIRYNEAMRLRFYEV